MKIRNSVVALVAGALLLTGCTAPAAVDPIPELTVAPVDNDGWEESTFEEFAAYFPDLDTSDLAGIPSMNVQHNDRGWVLGSGDDGYIVAYTWATEQADLERDGDDAWEATFRTSERAIWINVRDMGEKQQFLLYVTSGE